MTDNHNVEHIAIIMDGNGRWAKRQGLPRSIGHKKGAEIVKEIAKAANEKGVKFLTLYAFSTENWGRPKDEVDTLMSLLRQYLKTDLTELKKNNIRIRFIGERNMLDADIVQNMHRLERETQDNTGMCLCLAISYGARQEILQAAQKLAALVKNGDLSESDVDIQNFSAMLYTHEMPDPDIVIRTSGEQRISNFLLWQAAYAEFFFTKTLWPDFSAQELDDIIEQFKSRERRYGKI